MMPMTLRTEIESLVTELDEEPAYAGAPLFVAVERLQEILAASAPRVLTTLEQLDSELAFEAFCIMPSGGPLRVAISRMDGINSWQEPGYDGEYTSAELLAHFASIGVEPRFTLIEGVDTPRDASAEVAAAFAKQESAKGRLVARAAGVDPAVAAKLGY